MSGISNTFVVVLGVSVVFTGLICIVLLCKIVSAICMLSEGKDKDTFVSAAPTQITTAAQPIKNRQEIIAAVSAAIAEELGADISAIRILSFKKI
ncbi:MAG: OadG family protein [Clostridia bacterium]|nr:OadG family protein [Clostridia bacterium]